MKIGIACGGTGGHIFPGLATAEELRDRGHEVILWLAGKKGEDTAISEWDGKCVTVYSEGLYPSLSLRNLVSILHVFMAVHKCFRIMRGDKPDILIAMGSYASVGPVLAARLLKVTVVLHEANVIPGRAVKFLSRFADTVAVGFDDTRLYLNHPRVVCTGMPVRRQHREIADSTLSKLREDIFTLLVTGGSKGASALNFAVSKSVVDLYKSGVRIQVIHLSGTNDEHSVRRTYEEAGVPHAVFAFLHDMPGAYMRSSMAVCRCGASTCAELMYYGVPALLVPYSHAVNQHQEANARVLEQAGMADVRAEHELTPQWLSEYISSRMNHPELLEQMRLNAGKMDKGNAASLLADLVLER